MKAKKTKQNTSTAVQPTEIKRKDGQAVGYCNDKTITYGQHEDPAKTTRQRGRQAGRLLSKIKKDNYSQMPSPFLMPWSPPNLKS